MDHARLSATADRAASIALKLVTAFNVLFLFSFLLAATIAIEKVKAQAADLRTPPAMEDGNAFAVALRRPGPDSLAE